MTAPSNEPGNDQEQPLDGDAPELTPSDNQPGQEQGAPATGGEGAQGAGGSDGFGTAD